MTKNIQKTIFCESPPEIVWEALTNPEELSAWLMATTDFKAEVGSRFTMQAKPMGKWNGKIYGEVLISEKFRVLAYTWKGDQMKSDTIVKWTLTPENDGTKLVLEHTGFTGFGNYILGLLHSMGWKRFLKKLNIYLVKNGKKKI